MSGKRTDLAELPPQLLALAENLGQDLAKVDNIFLAAAQETEVDDAVALSLCLDIILKSTALLGFHAHEHLKGRPMPKDFWLRVCTHAFEHIERIETGPANDR
ncbi:MAG: hypothetical protein QNJ84_11770 [Alphaproteobacteria bacterium]|nr:hypothetical protein [Alphaproteobacteria bacterium]